MFSTGYVANVSTISGLLNRHDYVVLDKDAHNSLLTGRAALRRHDEALRAQRRRPARPRSSTQLPAEPGKGVIVDGVYSMGGDTAPLDRDGRALPARTPTRSCSTTRRTVSACSATRGRGAAEHYGVLDDVDLITITFSKTLGSCGGALIGSADAIELLTLDADPLIFTASNTPGSIAAALAGLRILRDNPEMTTRLRDNVDLFVGLLTERGVPVNPPESAIITIPLRQRDEVSAVVLARELLEAGVFVNPVSRRRCTHGLGLIRLSLMLDHTPALLEEAAEAISRCSTTTTSCPRASRPLSAGSARALARLLEAPAPRRRGGAWRPG